MKKKTLRKLKNENLVINSFLCFEFPFESARIVLYREMKGKGEQSEDETRNEQPDNASNAFEMAIKQSIEEDDRLWENGCIEY